MKGNKLCWHNQLRSLSFSSQVFCDLLGYRGMWWEVVRRVVMVHGAPTPASTVQMALQSGLDIKDMWDGVKV